MATNETPLNETPVNPGEPTDTAPAETAAAEPTPAEPAEPIAAKPKAAKKKKAKPAVPRKAKPAPAKKAASVKPKAAKTVKPKVAKTVEPKAAKAVKPKAKKALKPTAKKAVKPKAKKALKSKVKKLAKAPKAAAVVETAELISSKVVYQGPLFRVLHDKLIEPGGRKSERDVIRHNGSVVILAIDSSKSKKNPWIVVERQYRHAAQQFLWELPAGKLDAGEDALAGAQRELAEETGYSAKKWKPLVEYYASPGFLGESMKVFLAEGLVAGHAHPEDDEQIEFRLVKLSDVLKMIEKGAILDGKTLTSVLLYARLTDHKRKK
jgi:ADP-ribose pyrophosphatase